MKIVMALCGAVIGCLAVSVANAAALSELIGQPVKAVRGETVGPVEDFVIDVRAGRVLYVIVDAKQRFFTLPVRALRGSPASLRLDMTDVNEVALPSSPEPRFRRAGRLLGQPVTNPGDGRIGKIREIEFDLQSGVVEEVHVATDEGALTLPASVLAHGRFPPLTRWQAEHPPSEVEDYQGYMRREPTGERKRLHDHHWERR